MKNMESKNLINPHHDLSNPDLDLNNFSDKDLYHLCQRYGNGIKILRRIFAVLLVEVNKRKLHRKYGFEGIFEFAAKVGGMNKALVDQILWLTEALKDKPNLWRAFKTEGWSKVRVVASVATKETDEIWAEKVRDLSKSALEVLVQAWKKQNKDEQKKLCEVYHKENLFDLMNLEKPEKHENSENLTNVQKNVSDNFPKDTCENLNLTLSEPKNDVGLNLGEVNLRNSKEKCDEDRPDSWIPEQRKFGDSLVRMRFKVTQETEFKFLLFKQRLCKKRKEALTSGEVLGVLLDGVEFKKI